MEKVPPMSGANRESPNEIPWEIMSQKTQQADFCTTPGMQLFCHRIKKKKKFMDHSGSKPLAYLISGAVHVLACLVSLNMQFPEIHANVAAEF